MPSVLYTVGYEGADIGQSRVPKIESGPSAPAIKNWTLNGREMGRFCRSRAPGRGTFRSFRQDLYSSRFLPIPDTSRGPTEHGQWRLQRARFDRSQ
jgi:hypothetical protein